MKKILDFWSVPHFLFGVVMALGASVFLLPPFLMFLVTAFIAVVWELVEVRAKIGELWRNMASDIALPLFAFPVTFVFSSSPALSAEHRVAMFVVVIFLYAYSNAIAWRARIEDDDADFKS